MISFKTSFDRFYELKDDYEAACKSLSKTKRIVPPPKHADHNTSESELKKMSKPKKEKKKSKIKAVDENSAYLFNVTPAKVTKVSNGVLDSSSHTYQQMNTVEFEAQLKNPDLFPEDPGLFSKPKNCRISYTQAVDENSAYIFDVTPAKVTKVSDGVLDSSSQTYQQMNTVEFEAQLKNPDLFPEDTGLFPKPKNRRISQILETPENVVMPTKPKLKQPLKPTVLQIKERISNEKKKQELLSMALQKIKKPKNLVVSPVKDFNPLVEGVVPRVKDITAPVKDVFPREEDIAAPVKDVALPVKDVAPPVKETCFIQHEMPESSELSYYKAQTQIYRSKYDAVKAENVKYVTANHKLLRENYQLRQDLQELREAGKLTNGLEHTKEDNGDLVYNCGITITAIQHAELQAFAKTARDDGKYVAALLQMVFGIEVLAVSSITGKAKNSVTTTQLCEKKLKFIKLMYLHRLGSGEDKSTRAKFFNEYVNRKIQNIRKELIRKQVQMEEKNE